MGLLLLAAGAYAATGSWRQRLIAESTESRRVIAAVEAARSAREQRAAWEQELGRRLISHPGDTEAWLELAQMRWTTAGPRAAAALLEASGESVADPRVLHLLAAAQRAMGREDLALATLDRGLAAASLQPPVKRLSASGTRDAEPGSGARPPHAAAHPPASDSGSGALQAERALLFALLGWFPQAEAALEDARRRGAPWLQVALVRATMARQHVDLQGARGVLEEARARYPGDAEVARQLAAVAEGERRFDEATRLLLSIAESEGDPRIWVALARIALREADPAARARAKSFLRRALDLRPAMPSARLLKGRALRLEGELEEARAILEALHRERPQEGLALFDMAEVYRALGEKERARALLARYRAHARRRRELLQAANAVMTAPESARAHELIGRLCLEEGKIGRAILSLERALDLDPRSASARALLARARQAADTAAASNDE